MLWPMIELREAGDHVYVLAMDNDENRFNAESMAALHSCLDDFDGVDGSRALVTTGTGKFFSNGLDLDWLMSDGADSGPEFMTEVHRLFGRILFNDAPTAAAINGHAFAGGAMLATVHDFRVMRSDRGYFCIPEVDLGLPLTDGMTAALQSRIPASTLHEAVVTGKRWGAEDMVSAGMAEARADEAEVLATATQWAASQAHHAGDTLGTMKRGLYPSAHATLLPTG